MSTGPASKNLQKMMASKYPSPSPMVMKETAVDALPKKVCVLTPKKILIIALLLAGLFFFLSLPYTYKSVGSLFPSLSHSSSVDPKLVALHALVFAIIAFMMLRMC